MVDGWEDEGEMGEAANGGLQLLRFDPLGGDDVVDYVGPRWRFVGWE
jgi:hypothetical protein